jgi:carbon monoxide dehydrogenase subunit G
VKFTLINKVSIISVTVLISGKLRNLRICAKEFQYNSSIWGFGGNGASVAKWLAHLPFTSKVAGSNLNEDFSL